MRQEVNHPGGYLLREDSPTRSRAVVSVALGSAPILPGAVLGMRTADGIYAPLAPAATDGTQVARAINYARLPAGAGVAKAVVTRGDCQVADGALVGLTPTAATQLAALGIVVQYLTPTPVRDAGQLALDHYVLSLGDAELTLE